MAREAGGSGDGERDHARDITGEKHTQAEHADGLAAWPDLAGRLVDARKSPVGGDGAPASGGDHVGDETFGRDLSGTGGTGGSGGLGSTGGTGRLGGPSHHLPIRVYFEDTDFSGVVYHASYVRWCERGRSDFLRLLGVRHAVLFAGEAPAAFVVRRMEFDFRRPARIDDVLEVRTSVASMRAADLWLRQDVVRPEPAKAADHASPPLICRAHVQVVLMSADGRPRRLTEALRHALGSA